MPIKKEVPFVRYDNGKKVESILMAIPNNEYEEVSYSSYMGGDIANTVIDTNRPYLPNILIYGDSYTNPLEMLLYASFNQMHSIDFRLFSRKDIMKYIRDNQIDIVLCIKDDTSYFYETGNGAVLLAG